MLKKNYCKMDKLIHKTKSKDHSEKSIFLFLKLIGLVVLEVGLVICHQ